MCTAGGKCVQPEAVGINRFSVQYTTDRPAGRRAIRRIRCNPHFSDMTLGHLRDGPCPEELRSDMAAKEDPADRHCTAMH